MSGAVFFSKSVVCITAVFDTITTFQFNPPAEKCATAVFASQQSAVSQDSVILSGTCVIRFPIGKKNLCLLPDFPADDSWQEIFVPELLFGFCNSESLVDFVGFAFMTDKRPGICFITDDADDHSCVPQIFFEDSVVCIGFVLI